MSFAKFAHARYNLPMTVVLRRVWRPLVVLALVALSLPAWPPTENASADATVRLRVGVTKDGIVEIKAGDLSPEVLALLNENPDAVAMSSMGQQVATRVLMDTLSGEFQSLQFFGQRFRSTAAEHPEQEEKYTDERAYWLDIGGAPGLKIPEVDAAPRPGENLTPPNDFLTTVRAEESNVWWTLTSGTANPALLTDNYDTWFWASLQTPPRGSITATLPYTLPHPAPGFPATLRLEEVARTWSSSLNPDHRTIIGINDMRFPYHDWDGKVRKVFTETVPPDVLVDGLNTVTACADTPDGASSTYTYRVYINDWEIDYRRLFRAWEGQVDFVAEENGPHEYLVSGWTGSQVETWDISDPNQPVRLQGAGAESNGGETSLRFYVADTAGTHFWMQSADKIAATDSLRLSEQIIRAEPNDRWVESMIVTVDDFRPAADRLARWHEDHGRHALVVDIEQVYDEFNDGIHLPKAVPLMLAWFATERVGGAPTYLTLMGDGHWNFKEDGAGSFLGWPNPIPPYLAWVDPWQGEVPADPLYGDLDFDGMPDVAVGRLAVNTLGEANTVVDKIVNYNQTARVQAWQQRALFVAERYSAGDWNYPSLTDDIIAGYLPTDISAQRVYLGQTVPDAPSARAAISDAVGSGVLMLQYSGHGDVDLWSKEAIWNTTDVSGLQNAPMLPVVMTFNCKDGYFAYPGWPSMAETWQR
jgi:Peptidase family C25